jgi:UDPglucose 6-dehydrogenase
VDAEIAKLAINVYLSVKIGFANTVARVCEEIPGADANLVCRAIGHDSRIGSKFISPGGPPGGPCLPRDLRAFATLGSESATSAICRAGIEPARGVYDWIETTAYSHAGVIGRSYPLDVLVLGLSYKPDTAVTEDSLGYHLAKSLKRQWGLRVGVHDPMISNPFFAINIDSTRDVSQAAVVIVATPWPEYSGISPALGQMVIDPWSVCVPGSGTLVRPGVPR